MTLMKAIIWEAPKSVRLIQAEKPRLMEEEDAILKIQYASTCGTDIHIYRGAVKGFVPGTILGHEFVGVVESVGAGVKKFEPGQRVRCNDFAACGTCRYCAMNLHTQCRRRMLFGFSGIQSKLDGGLANYTRIPWADTVLDPLGSEIDARAGLLAADVLPTALGAVECLYNVKAQNVAIIGGGPVGLLAAYLAGKRGIKPVLFEVNPSRLDWVKKAGIKTARIIENSPEAKEPWQNDEQFDACIDAVGGEIGMKTALGTLGSGGCYIGVGSQGNEFALNWLKVFQREFTLKFLIGSAIKLRPVIDGAIQECLPFLDFMFSDHISIEQVPEYYALLYNKEKFKAIVHLQT